MSYSPWYWNIVESYPFYELDRVLFSFGKAMDMVLVPCDGSKFLFSSSL